MSVTLLVPYSASGQDNGGVKMDVPAQSADPGEPVRMYLWGRSREALDGYALNQGAARLGAGRLGRYDGQTEMALFDLDGSGGLSAFTWPVLSLAAVVAVGRLYHVVGNAVSLIALPGENVTRYFRLSGNALAAGLDRPVLTGTVAATAPRSPWCREWEWIAPRKPAEGLPEGTCSDDEDERDGAAYWFFLMRYGSLVSEFSLTLSEYDEGTADPGGDEPDADACGWTATELDYLFDSSRGLVAMYRACNLSGSAGQNLTTWPDESGVGNTLYIGAGSYNPSVIDGLMRFSIIITYG
jgi:hypothetical protein